MTGDGLLGDREGELTLTSQDVAAPVATVALDGDRTVTEVWQDLLLDSDVQDEFVRSVRAVAAGRTPTEFVDALEASALAPWLQTPMVAIAAGESEELDEELPHRATVKFVAGIRQLGSAWYSELEEMFPAARLFGAGSQPTIAVSIDRETFGDQRRDQREALCQLLTALAHHCDVRVVGSGLDHRWLATEHQRNLPGDISEQCSTARSEAPQADLVATARDELSYDGSEVAILRALADESTETLSYHQLRQATDLSQSRASQCFSRLEGLGLIGTFRTGNSKSAELLAAGRQLVDEFDEDLGRQQQLRAAVEDYTSQSEEESAGREGVPDEFSDPPKSSSNSRAARACTGEGEAATRPDRCRLAEVHETHLLPRWLGDVAAVEAGQRDITLLDHPIEELEDRGTRLWSYDHDADRLLVAAEYDNPMQHAVCVALALADVRTWSAVAPPERIKTDVAADPELIRDKRCIGAFPDEAIDEPEVFIENIKEWAAGLCEMTRDLWHGNYQDRNSFRGDITQSALGLMGTVSDMLDLLDVDVVRVTQVPRAQTFDEVDEQTLAEHIGVSTAVMSRYRDFSAYRQLFEEDEERRAAVPTLDDVDATDPHGVVTTRTVVVGPNVSDFESTVRSRARNPRELHEDAPEFAVPVTIGNGGRRQTYHQSLQSVCSRKNLEATAETTALLRALTGTPVDAARAVSQGLSTEGFHRELRLEEVRVALSTLDWRRILPGTGETVQKVVKTLLTATEPLSQRELADRAGVTEQSIRDNRGVLEALDLLRETADGWRLSLPFRTSEERWSGIKPELLECSAMTTVTDVLWEIAEVLVPTDRLVDPDDPIGGAFYAADPPGELQEVWPEIEAWVDVVVALLDQPVRTQDIVVSFGPSIEQQPIAAVQGGAA